MKFKKITAALTALFAAASLSVSVFAADYSARLGFADADWTALDWETCTTITGNGTYTIESSLVAGADDFGVMIIEIEDMYAQEPKATAVLDKIVIDGKELEFDPSKIVYGNLGKDGNYVIEIFSAYGSTVADPGVKQATKINSSLKLTFTVSGLGDVAAETSAPDTEMTVSVTTVPKTEISVSETTEAVTETETGVPATVTTIPKTETSTAETTTVTKTETNAPETAVTVPHAEESVPKTEENAASDNASQGYTPESDGSTESVDTGNMSVGAIAAVMACAGVISAVSRKKKA